MSSSLRAALPLPLLFLAVAPPIGADDGAWPNVAPPMESILQPALGLAATRLERPSCSAVFDDFRVSATGKTLSETLSSKGVTPLAYLRSIHFIDGSTTSPCSDRQTLAHTPVGGPVVFVCREQFLTMLRRNWGYTATVVIHESLHSLGLGENPPTTDEISRRIENRCGH